VGNWADFITTQKKETLHSFQLEDFMGLVHGERTGEEIMEKQQIKSVSNHGVYFDKVNSTSALEFWQ